MPHNNQQLVDTNKLLRQYRGENDGLPSIRAYCASKYNNCQPFGSWSNKKSMIREGGSEPLEHIDIFKHGEDLQNGIPEHWHFIGYGLSDLYNYRILYELFPMNLWEYYPPKGPRGVSGFGIELTLRVQCHENEKSPPEWPRIILQNLARYIFEVRIACYVGDHLAFNHPLDGEESRIRHILMMEDPTLKTYDSHTGSVKFIQLVGVCDEELEAARQWNVMGLLQIMQEHPDTGGRFLVTDMRRGGSVFEILPSSKKRVEEGILRMGSDMSSISTMHKYCYYKPSWYKIVEKQQVDQEDDDTHHDSDSDCDPGQQEKLVDDEHSDVDDDNDDDLGRRYGPSATIERGNLMDLNRDDSYATNNPELNRTPSRMSYESESELLIQNIETCSSRQLVSVYLLVNRDSARVFPIILRDRLSHRKCFSFQNFKGDLTTTFVPEGSPSRDLMASSEKPFVKQGPLLYIFVSDDLLKLMIETIGSDFERTQVTLPKNYSWEGHNLYITVADKIEDLIEAKN